MSIIASGTTSGTALVSTGDTNGNLVFQTNGTTTALTLSTAQLATFAGKASFPSTIGVGGATPSASGVGISFPSAISLSTDPNTLDDYEEGTWTPGIAGSTSAGTVTYSNRFGRYTRIGNLVYFDMAVAYSAGTGTGLLKITGLPFSIVSSSGVVPANLINVGLASSANTYVVAGLNPSSTDIYLNEMTIATGGTASVAYDAAATLYIAGCFNTST
jgi:hypothetical protein